MSNREQRYDQHFDAFTQALRFQTRKYEGMKPQEMIEVQRQQVEELARLELEWRKAVVNSRYCEFVYVNFVRFIRDELNNIRAARPFFRERQEGFSKRVSAPLQRRAWRPLLQLHPNYHFVRVAMASRRWDPRLMIVKLARKIEKTRNELVVINMPLAISRAKLFWGKTPHSHLEFMDLVSLGADGLIACVDKFCGEYAPGLWPSVAVQRINGTHIEHYSQTSLHFYPLDKQRLYRARKALAGRPGRPKKGEKIGVKKPVGTDEQRVLGVVNENVPDVKLHATTRDVEMLVAAASTVSGDTPPSLAGDDTASILERQAAPDDTRPDVRAEESELRRKLSEFAQTLPMRDRKFLKLKGIDVHV